MAALPWESCYEAVTSFTPVIILCLLMSQGECKISPSKNSYSTTQECNQAVTKMVSLFTESLKAMAKERGDPLPPMRIAGACRSFDKSLSVLK